MWLVVGLGNPGKKYAATRHNVGWLALEKFTPTWQAAPDWQAEIATTIIAEQKIILARPQTFMNESGRSVAALLHFYKLTPEQLVVVHDDLDFPVGVIKIQKDRSAAGHNGVASIIEHLHTQNFYRVRLGITGSEKNNFADPADYVLSNFLPPEKAALQDALDKLPELLQNLFTK